MMGRFITVLVEGTQPAFLYNNSPVERITQVLVRFMLNSDSILLTPLKTGHWWEERSQLCIRIFVCAFFVFKPEPCSYGVNGLDRYLY